ncbi:MAG: sugar nucleotide-binding protein [Planctomycetaceae bacterium]|nr:sugar nucleotide-binding protein [Planctomycetaceae bacterium]
MDSILVVGVDGVVGANCAAILSAAHPVLGVARSPLRTDFCPVEVVEDFTAEFAAELVREEAPTRILYCGAGAESCWGHSGPEADEIQHVEAWLQAATAGSAAFTLISSDAVFTGPWMFHAENSQSFCRTPESQVLQQIVELVLTQRPDALVVRTHAFGWEPAGAAHHLSSWMEQVLSSLQAATTPRLDYVRHASPILASDLAVVVEKAWGAGLAGVYHIAGAERANPVQFSQRLAHQFGLGFTPTQYRESLTDPALGFGRGETSLQTRKIRRALGLGLPLLSEGLERLHEQSLNGYRTRLQGSVATARVA